MLKIKSKTCQFNKLWDILAVIVSMVIIFLATSTHIQESNGIKVWGDEIGYWQNAALLTGRDWSGMASTNKYYGYGYGFLLAPIVRYAETAADMMHAAIILQIFMLGSCIIPIRYMIKKLAPNMSRVMQLLVSLAAVLYAANVFFVNLTMAEILLVTCMWWLLFAWMRYVENGSKAAIFFLIAIPLYMYSVQQRMIVHIIITLMFVCMWRLISINCRERFELNIIWLIVFLALFIIGFTVVQKYEQYYTNTLYVYADSSSLTANKVSSHTDGVLSLVTSPQGWFMIVKSLCGKLFYAFVGTYGLVLAGTISGVECLYRVLIKKQKTLKNVCMLFSFFNFLAAIAVASLAMVSGYETRNDILMYGRYSEYTYGPMILAGLIYIYEKLGAKPGFNKREKLYGVLALLILGVICANLTVNTSVNSHFYMSDSALGDLRAKVRTMGITNKEIILLATLRCAVAVALLYVIKYIGNAKKYKLFGVWMIAVIALWINTANVNWNENVMSWYATYEYCCKDIVRGMEDENYFGTLDANMAGCFQFELKDAYMCSFDTLADVWVENEYMYIITDVNSEYVDEIRESYDVDRENDKYIRWIYKCK